MRSGFAVVAIVGVLLLDPTLAAETVFEQQIKGIEGQAAAISLTPIRSQADLDRYLAENAGQETPFDALPAGARKRFLVSLGWGSRGLGGFNPAILADELLQFQIEAILSLFGDEAAANAPQSRVTEAMLANRSTPTTEISELESRYNEFYFAIIDSGALSLSEQADLLSDRFEILLGDAYSTGHLAAVDDRHLAMLWNAAQLTAGRTFALPHIEALQTTLSEYSRRGDGMPPGNRLRDMRNLLLSSRRFDEAQALMQTYPGAELAELPVFIDTTGVAGNSMNTIWEMNAEGLSLNRKSLDLAGTRILVTAGCHFSEDAAADIAVDPVLSAAFARHAHWLMLPPGNEDIDAVKSWNSRFPASPALLIYSRDEWPIFEDWLMPRFHIVRDGRVIESISGWPRDDEKHRQALIEMLQRAELINSPG